MDPYSLNISKPITIKVFFKSQIKSVLKTRIRNQSVSELLAINSDEGQSQTLEGLNAMKLRFNESFKGQGVSR